MKRFVSSAGAAGAWLAMLLGLACAHVSAGVAFAQAPDPLDYGPPAPAFPRPVARVDDARLLAANDEPGQWLAHGRTFDEQRYSPLASINKDTVARLGLAWTYEPGTRRGMEATPLVIDGVMYATGEWSRVYALDARTGKSLWTYDPYVPGAKGRDACCDVVNRGVAAWEGKLYLGALDGRLICLDAATGKPLWEKQTTDTTRPYTITGAPRIVRGKVIIGNGGAEFGVRGYFSAYDANTGEMLWRFYTVPASREGPFENPELEKAAPTWAKNSAWDSGLGGTVWDSMAYDPELDLLFVGVGNASVYNREQRSPGGGDNLYLSSILAVRPDTGRLVWHYQTTPGDQWDYTATQHMILADIDFPKRSADGLSFEKAEKRRVLLQAPKNGFFYVLDRATGELLAADPYIEQTWATGVDLATGRPAERPEASWSNEVRFVTPGISGGHNWHPMAFSAETGLVYIPTFSSVYTYRPDPDFRWAPGYINTSEKWRENAAELEGLEPFVSQNVNTHLTAWNPATRSQAWRVELGQGIPAGVLATAGGLVFQGTTWGELRAYDAATGALVWQAPTGTGIIAPPISFELDGEQYIAVVAGLGGSAGGHFIKFPNANPGRILAFKLDAKAELPPMPEMPKRPGTGERPVEAPVIEASAEMLARGRDLYAYNCSRCHGLGVQASGLYPDLRHSSKDVYASWNAIVLGGVFAGRGMASFADVLSKEDSEAIRAYVASRARHDPGWIEWFAEQAGGRLIIPPSWFAN